MCDDPIEYRNGDLLTSGERYIMHGCNNQGLMESGIAKQIALRWPIVWNEYRKHYERDGLKVGSFHIVMGSHDRPYVINAITQTQGGIPLSYDALVKIFSDLNTVNLGKDRVLAIPRIGAGVAGGSWPVIEEIIRSQVKTYKVRVYVPGEIVKPEDCAAINISYKGELSPEELSHTLKTLLSEIEQATSEKDIGRSERHRSYLLSMAYLIHHSGIPTPGFRFTRRTTDG